MRLHAGVRGDTGTLAIQLPGPAVDTGGDVLLRGVAPTRIPDAIASALPRIPAGSRSPVRFPPSRPALRSGLGAHIRRISRVARRGARPAGSAPQRHREITAFAGVAYDSRPTTTASRCTGSTSTATAATSCGATPMSWSGPRGRPTSRPRSGRCSTRCGSRRADRLR
ncbi:hypothetical protein GS444_16645, partial [Rhodococcus hoagii]|nr:hypothetical protein [Prescottella equi]